MNYPLWELSSVSGGTLIAIIAIAHVLIAHFAVGGGLYLVLTEMRARKKNDQVLLSYVRSHTRFFLLLTMVFGGLSGVGIWFIIGLVSPAATSSLIHNFVFGWATEWVFFIAEIVALLIYHYRFDKMSARNHIRIGWLYFLFAWLSLFIINGILGYMLTPGKWLETQNFWHGFFNPSFWPALTFRTGIALFMAGLFGLVTAVFNKDREFKSRIFRYNVQWLFLPFLIILISGFWYASIVPDGYLANIFQYNTRALHSINLLVISSLLLFLIGILFLLRLPPGFHKAASFMLILVGLGWMAGFEYIREIGRKPYVLGEYMYSNSVYKSDLKDLRRDGFLYHARFTEIKSITGENFLLAGEEIFRLQCLSCHTRENGSGIKDLSSHLTLRGIEAQLTGQGQINTYMPPFMGTETEKRAVAAYLFQVLHGKEIQPEEPALVKEEALEIPGFNESEDEYVLLAWNDLGMHCISDNDKYFVFLPPANTIWAQLVKRGPRPELITSGVKLEYEVEEGFKNPQNHVPFWEYAPQIFGAELEEGVGLTGLKVDGYFHANEKSGAWVAEFIPVVPYRDDGSFNPYPLFTVKAMDESTGEVLAMTRVVAPTSTEMGCRNCHGGGWRVNDYSGVADETAINILQVHDKRSGTRLYEEAMAGNPALCQSCHADPAVGAPGKPDIINFSAAMHGFHANYLRGLDHEACILCHPGRKTGNTSCSRGRHDAKNLTCIHCHGSMEDHGRALLKHEKGYNKKAAFRTAANLEGRSVPDMQSVNPRIPWLMEPDCQNCHGNFDIRNQKVMSSSFNNWVPGFTALYRNRQDNQGMMCAACHGSPHAIYPTINKYGKDRDNIQALQYMGIAGTIGTQNNCQVCHTVVMKVNGHHRNMGGRLGI